MGSIEQLACAALSALKVGEPGNEGYDVALFSQTFPEVLRSQGFTQKLRLFEYDKILRVMIQHCCQHGEETACNLHRCNYHVRKELEKTANDVQTVLNFLWPDR